MGTTTVLVGACVCEMCIYMRARGPCKGNEFLRHESFPCAPLPPRRITCVEGVIAVRPLSMYNMHAHTHPRPTTDDNTTRDDHRCTYTLRKDSRREATNDE